MDVSELNVKPITNYYLHFFRCRIRIGIAGDANDIDLLELATSRNGSLACDLRHAIGLGCIDGHHAKLVPIVHTNRSNRSRCNHHYVAFNTTQSECHGK